MQLTSRTSVGQVAVWINWGVLVTSPGRVGHDRDDERREYVRYSRTSSEAVRSKQERVLRIVKQEAHSAWGNALKSRFRLY